METMQAVRKTRPERGFELCEIPVPKPGKGELLMKVMASSVCGTDVHIYNNDPPWNGRIRPPRTIGHEVAGEVVGMGEGTEGFAEGDLVSAESHIFDRTCGMCRTGNMHICQNFKFFGVDVDGFWARYALLPQQNAWKNPPGMKPEIATLQESMGNSVYTVQESNVGGKTVAVFGSGPTGLFATAIAKAMGATKVMTVYGSEFHAALVKKMGADILINRHEQDPVQVIKEKTDSMGADVVLEMSGAAQAFTQALKAVRMTGQLTVLGLPTNPISVNVSKDIILKDITLRGVYGRKLWDTWLTTSRLLSSGRVDITPIITHRLGLEDFEQAIEAMKSGQSGKCVFFPE